MIDYEIFINALRKCAKEHENDVTLTGHIVVSRLCRDTANLLEALEQEPILDNLKAEIEQMDFDFGDFYDHTSTIREMVLKVIDKYKVESEE